MLVHVVWYSEQQCATCWLVMQHSWACTMITEVAAFNMHRDDVQNNQWSKRELTWSGVRQETIISRCMWSSGEASILGIRGNNHARQFMSSLTSPNLQGSQLEQLTWRVNAVQILPGDRTWKIHCAVTKVLSARSGDALWWSALLLITCWPSSSASVFVAPLLPRRFLQNLRGVGGVGGVTFCGVLRLIVI